MENKKKFLVKLTFASVAFIERRTVTFVVTIGHSAVSTVKAGAWVTNVTWKETKVLGILQQQSIVVLKLFLLLFLLLLLLCAVRITKKALYLRDNVFSTKVLIRDTIFYVSNWRRDRHFTWSSETREGLACCSAKEVPSFLGYFKTLSIGPAPGIEPATSRSAINTLYRLS